MLFRSNHRWAAEQARRFPPPWTTCEAVLSETTHLLGSRGTGSLAELLRRRALVCRYGFADDMDAALKLLLKYADVPMGFAEACLVRMTETLPDPVIVTTDSDFKIYRRHSRQVVPCLMP